ncbi:MAG: hypothetical protein HFJ19_03480 [Clostridia bacterium]|nr:hypothetical protein [Clostridia bacterium]
MNNFIQSNAPVLYTIAIIVALLSLFLILGVLYDILEAIKIANNNSKQISDTLEKLLGEQSVENEDKIEDEDLEDLLDEYPFLR